MVGKGYFVVVCFDYLSFCLSTVAVGLGKMLAIPSSSMHSFIRSSREVPGTVIAVSLLDSALECIFPSICAGTNSRLTHSDYTTSVTLYISIWLDFTFSLFYLQASPSRMLKCKTEVWVQIDVMMRAVDLFKPLVSLAGRFG